MAGSSKKGAAWSWRRLALGAACVAGLGAAGYVGSLFLPRAKAQAPAKPPAAVQPGAPTTPGDYNTRPVAFLHHNEAITREQLGEYLIARYGADKLPLLVNKIIIEEACKAKGIDVTPAEVEVAFTEDLASMNMDEKTFVNGVLKQAKKSLYEWKEDVVRPKLLMTKLVRDSVKVSEDDIKAAYEAYFGEKVEIQIIYWPVEEKNVAMQEYATIRDHDDEFQRKARMQADSRLAATAGHLDSPISHHSTGSNDIEKAAFSLREGEVSALMFEPEGIAVIKCLKRIKADTAVSLEKARPQLYKEAFAKELQRKIPEVFKQLQQQAGMDLLLKDPNQATDLTETTKQALSGGKTGDPAKGVVPASGAH